MAQRLSKVRHNDEHTISATPTADHSLQEFVKASREYMNVFNTRPFPNVIQELLTAQGAPGTFERLHSDKKSATKGLCTIWIRYIRPPTKAKAGTETSPYFEAHMVIAAGDKYKGDTKQTQFKKMEVRLPASIGTALEKEDDSAIAEAFKATIIKEWEVSTFL